MHAIQISDTNFNHLMALANPLFSVDDVLERLLDGPLARAQKNDRSRASAAADVSKPAIATSASDRPGPAQRRERGNRPVRRASRGCCVPQDRYCRAILVELGLSGGAGTSRDIQERSFKRLRHEMTDFDLAPLPKNKKELRWRNHARFARNRLVQRGYLKRDSEWGTWELTTLGSHTARKLLDDFDRSGISFT